MMARALLLMAFGGLAADPAPRKRGYLEEQPNPAYDILDNTVPSTDSLDSVYMAAYLRRYPPGSKPGDCPCNAIGHLNFTVTVAADVPVDDSLYLQRERGGDWGPRIFHRSRGPASPPGLESEWHLPGTAGKDRIRLGYRGKVLAETGEIVTGHLDCCHVESRQVRFTLTCLMNGTVEAWQDCRAVSDR